MVLGPTWKWPENMDYDTSTSPSATTVFPSGPGPRWLGWSRRLTVRFTFTAITGRHRGSPLQQRLLASRLGATQGREALKILEKAGTSKDYMGLWRDVEKYTPPAAGAELPELVEIAAIDSLAAAMAKIDRAYDNLKLCQEAKWSTPQNHPDLVPALQAFLVREGLHESGRHFAGGYDDQFRTWLSEAEEVADGLGQAVLSGNLDQADEQFETLMRSCKRCHDEYRN